MEMTLLLLFFVKHLICDFPLQGPFQYQNKGTYGHFGGILHVAIHFFGSLIVLGLAFPFQESGRGVIILAAEALIHYHIDWSKVQICRKMNWQPMNSEYYWWLLGLDQFLHTLTYFGMVWCLLAWYGVCTN